MDWAFAPSANHLAFGMGRHFCLGSILAKAELEVGANLLLDGLPDLHFVDGKSPRESGFPNRLFDVVAVERDVGCSGLGCGKSARPVRR